MPWLIEGKPIVDVLVENIRLTSAAPRERVGVVRAASARPAALPTAWPAGPICAECCWTSASGG